MNPILNYFLSSRTDIFPQIFLIMKNKRQKTTPVNCGKPHIYRGLSLARQEGLEPPTHCLEGSCSIHLSYWRIKL